MTMLKMIISNSAIIVKGLVYGGISSAPFWLIGLLSIALAIFQPAWIIEYKGISTFILFGTLSLAFAIYLSLTISKEHHETENSHTLYKQRIKTCLTDLMPFFISHMIFFWLWWFYSSELFFEYIPGAYTISPILLSLMLFLPAYEYSRILLRKSQIENHFMMLLKAEQGTELKNWYIVLANLESIMVLAFWLVLLKFALYTTSYYLDVLQNDLFFILWVLGCVAITTIFTKVILRYAERFLIRNDFIMWESGY